MPLARDPRRILIAFRKLLRLARWFLCFPPSCAIILRVLLGVATVANLRFVATAHDEYAFGLFARTDI